MFLKMWGEKKKMGWEVESVNIGRVMTRDCHSR